MTIFGKHLPRRTVLRGVGATIALPLLDSIVPALRAAAAPAAQPIKRFGAVYIPHGQNMAMWTPSSVGSLELSPTLEVMADFRDRMTIVSGLDSKEADDKDGGAPSARHDDMADRRPREADGGAGYPRWRIRWTSSLPGSSRAKRSCRRSSWPSRL